MRGLDVSEQEDEEVMLVHAGQERSVAVQKTTVARRLKLSH